MMEEETKMFTGLNFRQKGKNCQAGKIIKGCVQDAGSKISIGSIPSNYQAIIYRHNSTKGFGTSSQRFEHAIDFVNIAPDQYKKEQASIFRWKSEQNFNKKGYGPLISKEKRLAKGKVQTPGPGNYDFSSTIETCDSESTKPAKQPSNQPDDRFKMKDNCVPGPGQYDPSNLNSFGCGWTSSFSSKVKRNHYLQMNATPGPGSYDWKQVTKPFHRSPANKQSSQDTQHVLRKLILGQDRPKMAENYELPDFQPKYSKIKNSPIFMEGMKDRFGDYRRQYQGFAQFYRTTEPGPGNYNIKSKFDGYKYPAQSSCFVSGTDRQIFELAKRKMGPNTNELNNLRKKRYNINAENKWV